MTKFRKQLKVDKALIRAVRNGVHGNAMRPALNGLHVNSDTSRLTLIASDGTMCFVGTQLWTGEDNAENWGDLPQNGVVIPNSALRKIKKGKPGDLVEIEIYSAENGAGHFEIMDGMTSINDTLIDYPFPSIGLVTPRHFAPKAEFALGCEVLAKLSAAGKEFSRADTRLRFEAPDESENGIPKCKIMVDYRRISDGDYALELQAFAMPVR